jgi:hypothetical protein
MASGMRAITINLRDDQYTAIERIAVERGYEGKMSRVMRVVVDEWLKWDKIRIRKRIEREHQRA